MIARWMIVLGALVVLAVLGGPLAVDTDSLAWAQTAPRLSAEKDKAAQLAQMKAKAQAALEAQQKAKAEQEAARRKEMEAAIKAAAERTKAKQAEEAARQKAFQQRIEAAKVKSEQIKAQRAREQAAFDAAEAAYKAKVQQVNAKLQELAAARSALDTLNAAVRNAFSGVQKAIKDTTGKPHPATGKHPEIARAEAKLDQAKVARDAGAAAVKTKVAEYEAAKRVAEAAFKAVPAARPK